MRLVIHIGSHKAGSTSIQNYCYHNRDILRSYGIEYPVEHFLKFPEQHSELATLLLEHDVGKLRKFFSLSRTISSKHSVDTFFLSGEDLCTMERHHVGLLHKVALTYFSDIKIVLILRNKREYLWSAYKFHLLRGAPLGEKAFRRQHYFSPTQCLQAWSGFDRMEIQVHLFELIKDDLLANFFQATLGIPVHQNIRENISLDYLTSAIYNIFLKAYDEAEILEILYKVNSRHAMSRFPIEDVIADDITLDYPDHDWELGEGAMQETLLARRMIGAEHPDPIQICNRFIDMFEELRTYFASKKNTQETTEDFLTKLYLRRKRKGGRSLKDLSDGR